jgi:type VI secretion system secreted protein VgrG
MSVLIEKLDFKINNNIYENYIIIDFFLKKELYKPNQLFLTLRKKELFKTKDDIACSIANNLLGAEININIETLRRDEEENVFNDNLSFNGIIVDFISKRNTIDEAIVYEIQAYSYDFLLLDNPHCYSFEDNSLDEILNKTISAYKDKITVDCNPGMKSEIPFVVQYNESSYNFLVRLAQKYGEFMYYEDNKMMFGKMNKLETLNLFPAVDIIGYSYKLNILHTNCNQCLHNYITYENTAENAQDNSNKAIHKLVDSTYNNSNHVYKKGTLQNLNSAVYKDSVTQIDETIKTKAYSQKAKMMVCNATTNRADLKIGSKIIIKEFFDKEDGNVDAMQHDELIVTHINHIINSKGQYENEITAIPLNHIHSPYANNDVYAFAETQNAIVVDNKDPERLGRVRVQFIWQALQKKDMWTPWIRIAQPHGGDNKGFYFIPEINEEVMVGFENGNAEKPYVIGTLFHGKQRPGANWYNNNDDIKAIRTRSGHTIEFIDTNGQEFIKIYDDKKENYVLTFSTFEKLIKLESAGNIEMYAENDIIMKAKNNIEMEADNNMERKAGVDINEEAGQNISREAGQDLTENIGQNMEITAGNNAETDIGNNSKLSVGNNQNITIGNNKDEFISGDEYVEANNSKQVISKDINIQASKIEQRGNSSIKVDGGSDLQLKGNKVKIN